MVRRPVSFHVFDRWAKFSKDHRSPFLDSTLWPRSDSSSTGTWSRWHLLLLRLVACKGLTLLCVPHLAIRCIHRLVRRLFLLWPLLFLGNRPSGFGLPFNYPFLWSFMPFGFFLFDNPLNLLSPFRLLPDGRLIIIIKQLLGIDHPQLLQELLLPFPLLLLLPLHNITVEWLAVLPDRELLIIIHRDFWVTLFGTYGLRAHNLLFSVVEVLHVGVLQSLLSS